MMSEQTRFLLNETDLPRQWYNILADSPVKPTPVLNPQTMGPISPDDLATIFPMNLIAQEVSQDRYIDIPKKCVRSTNCGGRLH
jgi:tryptophan synthase beta chain